MKFLSQLNQANPIRIPWSSTNKIRFCFDNSLATLQWNVCISWLPIQKSIAITIFLRLQFTICMKHVILNCRYYFTCRLNAISIMWPLSWFRNKVTPSKRNNYLEMEVPVIYDKYPANSDGFAQWVSYQMLHFNFKIIFLPI